MLVFLWCLEGLIYIDVGVTTIVCDGMVAPDTNHFKS